MSVQAAVAQGREAAEARMTDHCTVTTGGTLTWNPSTEVYDVTGATTVYAGACRVKDSSTQAAEPDAGETEATVLVVEVHVPADVVGPAVGNTVTLTAAEFTPSLVGLALRLRNFGRNSQGTKRILFCTEVQSV